MTSIMVSLDLDSENMFSCCLENRDDIIPGQDQNPLANLDRRQRRYLAQHQAGETKFVLGTASFRLGMPPEQDDAEEADRERRASELPSSAATTGRRRHRRQRFSSGDTGRAEIGRPSSQRRRSSAMASAEA